MKEQNKTPKKQKVTAGEIVTLLLLLLVGVVCGILTVEYADPFSEEGGGLISFAILFIGLYVALILQLILHEGGHLLFGLLTGYRFVSFRIFSFILVRTGGKLRLRRFSLAGTGGQCLMAPPKMKDGRIPVVLYNLGGVIVNLVTAALFLVLFLLFPDRTLLSPFLLFLSIFGFTFALQNGIPMRTGTVDNDGRNALSLGKNPAAMRALWVQLAIGEQIAEGLRLREMPDEWFTLPSKEDMQNPLIATLAVFAANRHMDAHRFTEAEALIDRLLDEDSGILGLHRAILICDRITLDLLFGDGTRTPALIDDTQNKLMQAMKSQPIVTRTAYIRALLSEKNAKKAATLAAAFDKYDRTYPYPNDLLLDRELITMAKEKANA